MTISQIHDLQLNLLYTNGPQCRVDYAQMVRSHYPNATIQEIHRDYDDYARECGLSTQNPFWSVMDMLDSDYESADEDSEEEEEQQLPSK